MVLLVGALGATTLLLTAGFPSGAPDRLPVLVGAVGLAVLAAASPARGIAIFSFLFPCAGLLARMFGGTEAVTWPGLLLGGVATGWCFRFLYDFESAPEPSRADGPLRALLAVWTIATFVAAARAVTLWAAVRRLFGRAVNGDGLPDVVALRETLFAFAALAGGAVFYFILRRSGGDARRRSLSACLAGTAVSAAAALLQRSGILPGEARPYWRLTGRLSGAAVDPNSLGLLCALLLLIALAGALSPGARRARSLFVFLLLGAGLVLSGSRSGVLLAGFSVVLLIFASAFPVRSRMAALAGLVLVAAGAAAAAFAPGGGSAGSRIAQTFDPALPSEYRMSARPLLWRAAARQFQGHPIVGAGVGAFTWELPDLLREEGRSLPTRDNPGSAYIQALAETGAIGFLVTVGAALALAALGWRRARTPSGGAESAAAGIAVMAFVIALVTGSHWLAPDVSLLFFLLAASASPEGERADGSREGAVGKLRLAAVLLYAAGAIAAVCATARAEETFRFSSRIGFHDREVGPGGPFRWTQRRFAIWLRPGDAVRLGLANFGPTDKPVGVEARVSGVPVFRRVLAAGAVTAVVLAGGRHPAAVVFVLDRSFVPRRLGLSSADRRTLGLLSTSSADPPPQR